MPRNTPGSGVQHREGSYNWNKTQQMRNGSWQDVNVVHRGQRAVLNGKSVTADGKGNWQTSQELDAAGNLSGAREKVGSYRANTNRSNFQSGLESNKIVVDGVTYDMNLPEHKALMNSRADAKVKKQHEKLRSEEIETPIPTRDVPRNGNKGTQTSPGGNKPGDLNAFAELLGSKYGIQYRSGFASNQLPSASGYSAADDAVMGNSNKEEQRAKAGGGFVEMDIDGSGISNTKINHGELAKGVQKGTSAVPDVGDQSRSIQTPTKTVMGKGGTEFGGEHEAPATSGISARSRAFLDYDGPGGSLMALRNAEAQSGYIRQNGRNFAINGTGEEGKREFTEFNDKGRQALVKDGNKTAGEAFLKDYMMGQTDAKAAENPAVEQPIAVEAQLEHTNKNMGPLSDTEEYGKIVDSQKGLKGMGPLADGQMYGEYLDGREPMMRGR